MPFQRSSGLRHTAQEQQFDVQIYYPHHPQAGERIAVERTVQHAGQLHFTIDLPDGARGLLPAWMTEPGAASCPLVDLPKLPIATLQALRLLIDAQPLSSASSNESQQDGGDVEPTRAARAVRPSRQSRDRDRTSQVRSRDPNRGDMPAQADPRRMRGRRGSSEADR